MKARFPSCCASGSGSHPCTRLGGLPLESTSAILRGRYTSHSSLFAQPQHGARTLPSSGMYPRECPFPASYQLPGPCGCALCQLPYPCRTFEQTSDIRTPASSAVCTRFGTRRGFGTRMHLPRIWNSKRHVGPTRWRPRQEDGSKPAPTAPVGCRQPPGLPQIRNLAILGGPGQSASDRRFLRVPDLPIG